VEKCPKSPFKTNHYEVWRILASGGTGPNSSYKYVDICIGYYDATLNHLSWYAGTQISPVQMGQVIAALNKVVPTFSKHNEQGLSEVAAALPQMGSITRAGADMATSTGTGLPKAFAMSPLSSAFGGGSGRFYWLGRDDDGIMLFATDPAQAEPIKIVKVDLEGNFELVDKKNIPVADIPAIVVASCPDPKTLQSLLDDKITFCRLCPCNDNQHALDVFCDNEHSYEATYDSEQHTLDLSQFGRVYGDLQIELLAVMHRDILAYRKAQGLPEIESVVTATVEVQSQPPAAACAWANAPIALHEYHIDDNGDLIQLLIGPRSGFPYLKKIGEVEGNFISFEGQNTPYNIYFHDFPLLIEKLKKAGCDLKEDSDDNPVCQIAPFGEDGAWHITYHDDRVESSFLGIYHAKMGTFIPDHDGSFSGFMVPMVYQKIMSAIAAGMHAPPSQPQPTAESARPSESVPEIHPTLASTWVREIEQDGKDWRAIYKGKDSRYIISLRPIFHKEEPALKEFEVEIASYRPGKPHWENIIGIVGENGAFVQDSEKTSPAQLGNVTSEELLIVADALMVRSKQHTRIEGAAESARPEVAIHPVLTSKAIKEKEKFTYGVDYNRQPSEFFVNLLYPKMGPDTTIMIFFQRLPTIADSKAKDYNVRYKIEGSTKFGVLPSYELGKYHANENHLSINASWLEPSFMALLAQAIDLLQEHGVEGPLGTLDAKQTEIAISTKDDNPAWVAAASKHYVLGHTNDPNLIHDPKSKEGLATWKACTVHGWHRPQMAFEFAIQSMFPLVDAEEILKLVRCDQKIVNQKHSGISFNPILSEPDVYEIYYFEDTNLYVGQLHARQSAIKFSSCALTPCQFRNVIGSCRKSLDDARPKSPKPPRLAGVGFWSTMRRLFGTPSDLSPLSVLIGLIGIDGGFTAFLLSHMHL